MKKNKIARILRITILVSLLLVVTYQSYMHQIIGGGKAPSIHALCPYGALESLYAVIISGEYLKKIFDGTIALFLITMVIALLFRRSFCGLLCPFGALQELFARLGKLIFKRNFVVPPMVDKPLRYLKYALIPLTLGMAWYTGILWMTPYDPFAAFGHISNISETIAEDSAAIVGFLLLGITIIGSLLYNRFFCKYLCPAGAFYALVGKLSATKINRNDDKCIHCNLCNKACPVNIDVEGGGKITSMECINCNECVNSCPAKGALEIKTAGKKVPPLTIIFLVLAVFFGGMMLAQTTGYYNFTNQSPKNQIEQGETLTISELKGYHTIEEASVLLGISLDEFYSMLGVSEDSVPKDTQLKNISALDSTFDFGTFKGE
ncbi:MAG: 4Fe-4S binding protein [Eubacteriales bacterium]|nr:4Fe-4S binding protein [Eubacteriales bacterium]MDD3349681.1 4Fe-4S binding protein [Eubacteriales bacterium]